MFASPKAPTVGAALLLLFLLIRLYPESPLSWERMLLACATCLADHLFSFPGVRCGHNVIHQNRPFSSLRAASLSVAACKLMTYIIAMYINVHDFMVNLSPLPSGTPRKTPPLWLNVAQSDHPVVAVCRTSSFILHPSSFVLRLSSFESRPFCATMLPLRATAAPEPCHSIAKSKENVTCQHEPRTPFGRAPSARATAP